MFEKVSGEEVAPAVSNIEPGLTGFSVDEAIDLLHSVRGMN
jgi:guanidinopropionase